MCGMLGSGHLHVPMKLWLCSGLRFRRRTLRKKLRLRSQHFSKDRRHWPAHSASHVSTPADSNTIVCAAPGGLRIQAEARVSSCVHRG